jgi:FG-GAP-like repeat
MRSTWRTRHLAGVAALAALGLVLASTPASSAEIEGTKNLSTPVILVDDNSMAAAFNAVTVPGAPTGTADYTNADGNWYTSLGSDTYVSTVDPSFGADTWGAQYAEEMDNPVVADVKWGDNLMTHTFPGNRKQPLRVEVNLFANADTAANYDPMQGYVMASLEGSMNNELFGTKGVAEVIPPMVYTPNATLSILQYDPAKKAYSTVIYDGPMTGEVNGSGKLIYGFNWGSSSGLPSPGAGYYRLVFTVADDSLVSLGTALLSEDSETLVSTPKIYGDKVSYLDVGVGMLPLSPAPPFKVGPKNDFNLDGYPDMYGRTASGDLWFEPGNGNSGFYPSYRVGRGWGQFTAIVAPGDFDGDFVPDLLARKSTGELWLYPGNGSGSFKPPVLVAGSGWNVFNWIVGVGDFNGDGNNDVMGRTAAGNLWLDPGNGAGGFLAARQVATGWNVFNIFAAANRFDADDNVDLVGRTVSTGALWLDPGNGTGGFLKPYRIATGWGVFNLLIA